MDGRLFTVSGVGICLLILGLWNTYAAPVSQWGRGHSVEAQPDHSNLGHIDFAHEPTDQWRGSSLGMNLVVASTGELTVDTLCPGLAADVAGIFPGDRLIRVGDIDFRQQGQQELEKYLERVPPNSTLKLTVSRKIKALAVAGSQSNNEKGKDAQTLNLVLTTDSAAMLDGWMVAESLKSNGVIQRSLQARGELEKLEKLRGQILEGVKRSRTPRIAYERINAWIDKLGVSHTAIIPAWGYARLNREASGGIGLTLERTVVDGKIRYFISDMEPGGPADESELDIGDEVLRLNRVPLEKSARLVLAGEEQRHQLFMITSEPAELISITCRKSADGGLSTIQLKADPKLDAVSASRSSLRVLQVGGKQVGYYRIWNLMSMEVDAILRKAIDHQFRDCVGLIIDLRGRGGAIPVVQRVEQTLAENELPVVVIVDRHSRSAKEILAIRLKGRSAVTLVGQRTSGAVAVASFARLPSGNALMFPVISGEDLRGFTRHVNLEGRGVVPDVRVDFDLPYLQGRDPLLEAAKKQFQQVLVKKHG